MAKLELAELRPVDSNLLLKAENQVNQLNESEMSNIKGGIDLKPAAREIIKIGGNTLGKAVTAGLSDLLGL